MAKANSIPAHVAGQISARIESVATMLRAMRTLAASAIVSDSPDNYEALSVAVKGLAERAHLILDACIEKMDGVELGNFRDDEWDTEDEFEIEGQR